MDRYSYKKENEQLFYTHLFLFKISFAENANIGIFLHISVLRHSATSFRRLFHLHCSTEATTMQGVNSAKGSRG